MKLLEKFEKTQSCLICKNQINNSNLNDVVFNINCYICNVRYSKGISIFDILIINNRIIFRHPENDILYNIEKLNFYFDVSSCSNIQEVIDKFKLYISFK